MIRFNRYRVSCPTCKIVTEGLDFLPVRGPRVTKLLAHLVYGLCKIATHEVVGLLFGLRRESVKNSDRAMMENIQSERPLDGRTRSGGRPGTFLEESPPFGGTCG